jgi:hypothetical protein
MVHWKTGESIGLFYKIRKFLFSNGVSNMLVNIVEMVYLANAEDNRHVKSILFIALLLLLGKKIIFKLQHLKV